MSSQLALSDGTDKELEVLMRQSSLLDIRVAVAMMMTGGNKAAAARLVGEEKEYKNIFRDERNERIERMCAIFTEGSTEESVSALMKFFSIMAAMVKGMGLLNPNSRAAQQSATEILNRVVGKPKQRSEHLEKVEHEYRIYSNFNPQILLESDGNNNHAIDGVVVDTVYDDSSIIEPDSG